MKSNYSYFFHRLMQQIYGAPAANYLPVYRRIRRPKKIKIFLFLPVIISFFSCTKNSHEPRPLNPSSGSKLARYDLVRLDYDVLPVTTFVFSYDSGDRITNVFEKSGQTLTSFALSWTESKLRQSIDNNLGVQSFSYDGDGRVSEIDYTTLTDTGKRVFTYGPAGKLLSVLDSVKKPVKLPALTQYLYTYDGNGDNVVQITQNILDLEGRPTLAQVSYYTFDDKANPFTASPWLLDATALPGSLPALFNKNNVIQSRIVGTIFKTSGGSSVPKLDSISNYVSGRSYSYNAKGYPTSGTETFQDLQYNYSGSRNFTYEY